MEFQDKAEFAEFLYSLSPAEFESLIADLWSELGWKSNVTQLSADEGIDVVVTKESPFSEKQLIQVKRYRPENTVGSPDIQQYASLRHQEENVDAVVVITSSSFSKQARNLAEKLNVKLIDGVELYELFQAEEQLGLLDNYAPATESDEGSGTSSGESTSDDETATPATAPTQPFESSVTLRWESETGAKYPQLILSDETLFVGGSNQRLSALESGAGIERWIAELPSSSRCVATNTDAVFAGCKDYTVYAVTKQSGEGKWSVRVDDVVGSITESDGVVYFRSHDSYSSTVHAVETASGELIWSTELDSGTHFGHVVVAGDAVFCSSDTQLSKLDKQTGETRWEIRGEGRLRIPDVDGDAVYVCNYEQDHLHAIDAQTGNTKWSYEAAKEIRSSPRVSDEKIYFGCQDSRLYAIDRESGSEGWHFGTTGPIKSQPAVTNSRVYCASSLGDLYAVDHDSGEPQGDHRLDNPISSMAVSGQTVYTADKYGVVSAIDFPE
jgi:outer membrane protein assembly factor BamB